MRTVDYARRLRFIELILSNAKNSDMMKEFGMSKQGVKWWLGKIYKELGVKNKKAMIASRSKFCGDLSEFIAYREKQARLNLIKTYLPPEPQKEYTKELPKWSKRGAAIEKARQKELTLKNETQIPILPIGAQCK